MNGINTRMGKSQFLMEVTLLFLFHVLSVAIRLVADSISSVTRAIPEWTVISETVYERILNQDLKDMPLVVVQSSHTSTSTIPKPCCLSERSTTSPTPSSLHHHSQTTTQSHNNDEEVEQLRLVLQQQERTINTLQSELTQKELKLWRTTKEWQQRYQTSNDNYQATISRYQRHAEKSANQILQNEFDKLYENMQNQEIARNVEKHQQKKQRSSNDNNRKWKQQQQIIQSYQIECQKIKKQILKYQQIAEEYVERFTKYAFKIEELEIENEELRFSLDSRRKELDHERNIYQATIQQYQKELDERSEREATLKEKIANTMMMRKMMEQRQQPLSAHEDTIGASTASTSLAMTDDSITSSSSSLISSSPSAMSSSSSSNDALPLSQMSKSSASLLSDDRVSPTFSSARSIQTQIEHETIKLSTRHSMMLQRVRDCQELIDDQHHRHHQNECDQQQRNLCLTGDVAKQ